MYLTKIKDKFFSGTSTHWWGGLAKGKEYHVIMTVDDMSLLCDADTGMMVDVFNNKLEVFHPVSDTTIVVEAKNIEYEERFGLSGHYRVMAGDRSKGVTKLKIIPLVGGGEPKWIFPSRLRVVSIQA